jgi:hypothetical protein
MAIQCTLSLSRLVLESLRGPALDFVGGSYNAFNDTFMIEQVIRFHLLEGIPYGFLSEWTTDLFHGVQ